MSLAEKAQFVSQVETQSKPKCRVLSELGVPKSTYYRWRRQTDPKERTRPWNRIIPNEERRILAVAREFPELSSRQLAVWITDNEGFAVKYSLFAYESSCILASIEC